MHGPSPVIDVRQVWCERLAQAMKLRGVDHIQLAKLVGTHRITMWRFVEGKAHPTDEMKWQIAGALGMRVDQLWAWPEIVPPFSPAETAA